MPRVSQATAPAPQPPSVVGPKRLTPVPNGLVSDRDAALGQQVFCIAKTQAEAMVEPDRVTDDLRWETVAVVAVLSNPEMSLKRIDEPDMSGSRVNRPE